MAKSIPIRNADNTRLAGSIGQGKFDLPTASLHANVRGKVQDVEVINPYARIEKIRQIKRQVGIKNDIIGFIQSELDNNPELRNSILSGKEVGHTISSYIDVETSKFLMNAGYPIKHEVNPKTQDKTTRSFGDIWIKEDSFMNPINIKTGLLLEDGGSNPNMTSMNRLKNSFLSESISAYYLAIIKFSILDNDEIEPVVYFIDALNFIDYLNYNMGTGQIMLKEKELYKVLETNPSLTLTREEKIAKLKALYARGLEEAERKIEKSRETLKDFDNFKSESEEHVCDPDSLICNCQLYTDAYGHIPKDKRHFL